MFISVYVYSVCAGALRGQEMSLDPLELESEAQHRYWDQNTGSLEEHQALLATKSSLQPYFTNYILNKSKCEFS